MTAVPDVPDAPGVPDAPDAPARTLAGWYARRKAAYAGRRGWEWEDEGKWFALADYYSCMGEFTDADRAFIEREGLANVAADVLDYMREQT